MVDEAGGDTAQCDPEHAADEAILAAYEAAKLRYVRAVTLDAERKLRYAFAERREAVTLEIADLRERTQTLTTVASGAAAAYATKLPHRVSKAGVVPPSLWERIVTLDAVFAYYRAARDAVRNLEEANAALRARRDRLDALERDLRRAIYLREDAVRKTLRTPQGRAALESDPTVQVALLKARVVMEKRAAYAERVARGEVPAEEARDRDMALRGLVPAAVPLIGAIVVGVARYGPLAYYLLRDVAGTSSLLAADPRLEPLRDLVFDVTVAGGGYDAALRHTAIGVPMRVLDHLKATLPAADVSDAYALHRVALREGRPPKLTPARDDAEAGLVEMLGLLADAVAGSGLHVDDEPAPTD